MAKGDKVISRIKHLYYEEKLSVQRVAKPGRKVNMSVVNELIKGMKSLQFFIPDNWEDSDYFKQTYDYIVDCIGPYNEDVTDVFILFEKGSSDEYILPFLDDILLFLEGTFYALRNQTVRLQSGKCTFEQYMSVQRKIAAETNNFIQVTQIGERSASEN